MDVQENLAKSATPIAACSTEDSGYQTSFTPSFIEQVELCNENLDPNILTSNDMCHLSQESKLQYSNTPLTNCAFSRKTPKVSKNSYSMKPQFSFANFSQEHSSPSARRSRKRTFRDIDLEFNFNSASTPSSIIAGGVQQLKVHDDSDLIANSINSFSSTEISNIFSTCDYVSKINQNVGECSLQTFSLPTTPVKRVCKRKGAKLSPDSHSSPLRPISGNKSNLPLKSVKKLYFGQEPEENENLILENKFTAQYDSSTPFLSSKCYKLNFKPEQKVDIIKMLYESQRCIPAIEKIFHYLKNEDIYNFSLVSPLWLLVCQIDNKANAKRQQFIEFMSNTKENHRNREILKNQSSIVAPDKMYDSSLRDIHNFLNSRQKSRSPKRSPPGTPRTVKFKKFAKSASLDTRIQLSCVRCSQPAKVTEEDSGEEWAECGSLTCAYQFCRFCNCDRHPGKKCFLYGLEAPSPSKRKRHNSVIGTKKSRKNLRRLLS